MSIESGSSFSSLSTVINTKIPPKVTSAIPKINKNLSSSTPSLNKKDHLASSNLNLKEAGVTNGSGGGSNTKIPIMIQKMMGSSSLMLPPVPPAATTVAPAPIVPHVVFQDEVEMINPQDEADGWSLPDSELDGSEELLMGNGNSDVDDLRSESPPQFLDDVCSSLSPDPFSSSTTDGIMGESQISFFNSSYSC